jgi:hypothetical protein
MMIPNQNANAMTLPTYAEAIVAVGRMLKPKAGEPRVHQQLRLPRYVNDGAGMGSVRTQILDPGIGRFDGAKVWPRDAA